MSYVLRYAGLLEESSAECDTARRLDPKNSRMWRSCALNFMQLGRFDRAWDYLDADGGSVFARNTSIQLLLRQGRTAEAREVARGLGREFFSRAVLAALENRPRGEVAALVNAEIPALVSIRDSEPKFWAASDFAHFGYPDISLRLLKRAVEQNFCGYPAIDRDPLLVSIRKTPEFAEIRRSGMACQQRFLSHRAAAGAGPEPKK
jgi:hypothetical protein